LRRLARPRRLFQALFTDRSAPADRALGWHSILSGSIGQAPRSTRKKEWSAGGAPGPSALHQPSAPRPRLPGPMPRRPSLPERAAEGSPRRRRGVGGASGVPAHACFAATWGVWWWTKPPQAARKDGKAGSSRGKNTVMKRGLAYAATRPALRASSGSSASMRARRARSDSDDVFCGSVVPRGAAKSASIQS
jgi:hypothetical protein